MNAINLIDLKPGAFLVHGDLVVRKHDFGVYSINDGGLGDFKATIAALEAAGTEVNFL